MSPLPHRRALLLLAGLAFVAIIGLLGVTSVPAAAARALVDAPNTGRLSVCTETAPEGADRELWVQVGAPRATLHAWVFEPEQPRGTILVLHGIEGRGSMVAEAARRYEAEGYRAVAVDLRGHGCSTGDWATYGITDAHDLSELIDALPADGPIGVHGNSYGGGAALQLAAHDPRVSAVVTVATFSTFRALAADHGRRRAGAAWPLVPDAFVDTVIATAGVTAGFDPDAAASVAAIAHTDARVLIIHGSDDSIIPVRHALALRDAAPNNARLVLLPGQDHESVQADRDGTVHRASADWFSRHMQDAPAPPHVAAKIDSSAPRG